LDKQNSAAGKQLIKLLSIPLDSFNNIITILKLENYAPLLSFLSYSARKSVAINLVENVLKNDTKISEVIFLFFSSIKFLKQLYNLFLFFSFKF